MLTSDLKVLGRTVFCGLVVCLALYAEQAATCAAPGYDAGTNIVVIGNAGESFCVDDYGYSHAWYPTAAPVAYDASLNTLGSSAQFIMYDIGGTPTGVGGWLSPQVWTDSGWVATSSNFVVDTPVYNISATKSESVINNSEVEITITSEMNWAWNGIKITYVVKNIDPGDGNDITSLAMVQYFDYHPAGLSGDADKESAHSVRRLQ